MRPGIWLGRCALVAAIVVGHSCERSQSAYERIFPAHDERPASLLSEHARLLHWADSILPADSAGHELRELLRHHFAEEEKWVFPLLAALPALAADRIPYDHVKLLTDAERFSEELGYMSAEHQMVGVLFGKLRSTGAEGVRELEKALHTHARLEEEVLFPAALVAAQQLREKTNR